MYIQGGNIMESHIQKWGNSLAIRIPMHLAKQLNLHPGSTVTLKIEGDSQLIIQTPRYDLKTMIEAITPENQHHQYFEDDSKKGNEEW